LPALFEAEIVKYKLGNIEITDVEGLLEGACECYGTVNAQYGQLLGHIHKLGIVLILQR
jgi:hypothetical protein